MRGFLFAAFAPFAAALAIVGAASDATALDAVALKETSGDLTGGRRPCGPIGSMRGGSFPR